MIVGIENHKSMILFVKIILFKYSMCCTSSSHYRPETTKCKIWNWNGWIVKILHYPFYFE